MRKLVSAMGLSGVLVSLLTIGWPVNGRAMATATSSPTPVPTVSPSPAVKPLAGELWISELVPNPAGTDTGNEWLELSNPTAHELDISGVVVQRLSGSKVLTIAAGSKLPAGGYQQFTALSGSLINTGDTLKLLSGTLLLDQIVYDDTGGEGQSWARIDVANGTWTDTLTPGAVNEFAAPEGMDSSPDSSSAVGGTAGNAQTVKAVVSAAAPKASVKAASSSTKATKTTASSTRQLPTTGPGWGWYLLAGSLVTLNWYTWKHA